ncbi:alpha-amylase family glycosyl hydrolase [Sharpea porci]|uniref:alpha-amylase family glycosyl hydrolase n=1 Tax=Sharpea porci TaxID=2652286 RepID=UPI0038B234E1
MDKLDYLHELGINGLYINSIYKAKSYHKYDVIDYTKVDEELGDEEDFKNLCKKAHNLCESHA